MNEKIDDIIDRLQAQHIELKGADELTNLIMDNLPHQSQNEKAEVRASKTNHSALMVIRLISSVAATLLILLSLWQISDLFTIQAHKQNKDFEQCIARYENDYSSVERNKDFNEAFRNLVQLRKSHPSIINQLKNECDEKK